MTVHVPAPIQESRTVTPNDQAPAMLPCPFCGGEATAYDDTKNWYVVCEPCATFAPGSHLTQAEAIAAWNKRAAIAALHAGAAVAPVLWKVTRPDGTWYTTDGPMESNVVAAFLAHGGTVTPLFTAPPAPTHDALRDANTLIQFGTCHEASSQDELHRYVEARDRLLALLAQEPTDGR